MVHGAYTQPIPNHILQFILCLFRVQCKGIYFFPSRAGCIIICFERCYPTAGAVNTKRTIFLFFLGGAVRWVRSFGFPTDYIYILLAFFCIINSNWWVLLRMTKRMKSIFVSRWFFRGSDLIEWALFWGCVVYGLWVAVIEWVLIRASGMGFE